MDLPTATFERNVTPIDFILAEEQAVSPFKVNSSTSWKVATKPFSYWWYSVIYHPWGRKMRNKALLFVASFFLFFSFQWEKLSEITKTSQRSSDKTSVGFYGRLIYLYSFAKKKQIIWKYRTQSTFWYYFVNERKVSSIKKRKKNETSANYFLKYSGPVKRADVKKRCGCGFGYGGYGYGDFGAGLGYGPFGGYGPYGYGPYGYGGYLHGLGPFNGGFPFPLY